MLQEIKLLFDADIQKIKTEDNFRAIRLFSTLNLEWQRDSILCNAS